MAAANENTRSTAERFWRWANRNLGLRALALAIAIGLWLFVNAGQRSAIEPLRVPISYRSLPAGMVIVSRPPDFVEIQVTGPRTLLSLLDSDRLTVRLDLSGVAPGQASFKITPSMFKVPHQTTITSVSPSEVVLDIDRVIQRELPVHVDVTGTPATGYQVAGAQAKPPLVTVIGPSRYLRQVNQIDTEPFDVRGLAADTERRVDLENPNATLALATVRVDARVSIGEKISDREFRGLHIVVRDSDYKFRVNPSHVGITVRGPALKIAELDPKTLAYVDAKELLPGYHEVPVLVNLPDGMQVVRQSPDKVRLRLYREKRSTASDEHAS